MDLVYYDSWPIKEIVMKSIGPNRFIRIANRMVAFLIRTRVPVGSMALLTVIGRRSGMPRTTPVTLTPYRGGWSLGSPFGAVDWVKNLRAAGEAEILRRGRTTRVMAEELGTAETAAVLKENLSDLGPVARRVLGGYFDVALDAPLADWEQEAPRHPTFILREQTYS
jgi:deazaflavin-dependent oxidoreductase (nitroreductase family)